MKSTRILSSLLFAFGLAACNQGPAGSSAQALVVDERCAVDADCPTGFECEAELEHGGVTSFCTSHDPDVVASGACPAGYELEEEHGVLFCKPHGADGAGGGASGGGAACQTDADCGPGLECEVEEENGTVTSSCKPHGTP